MNLRELRQQAAKHELSLNFVAKDLIISETLQKLQDFNGLVFKGGTAINRVYLRQNMRFSEDIDMDISSGDTDKIVESLRSIFDNVSKPRKMHSVIRYDLFFTNPLDHKDKIRLEFRPKKINENYSGKMVSFGFVPAEPAFLNVYDKEVLIAHKTECVKSRKEGKDIYDLYYLSKGHNIVDSKLSEALNLNEDELKRIANTANHYIPVKKRPDWKSLIEELRNRASGK